MGMVDRETYDVLDYAELYQRGLAPISGGVLDQSHWFVRACRFIWADTARMGSK